MTGWWLLLAAVVGLSAVAVAALCQAAKRGDRQAPSEPPGPYMPPPITDQYVTNEFAVIWWNYNGATAPDPQEQQ